MANIRMCRLKHIARMAAAVGILTLPCYGGTIYSVTNLGNLGGADITATGINSLGQVSGYGLTATGDYHAFLWGAGVMTDLGVSVMNFASQAMAINSSGQVAGTQSGNAGSQAGTWSAGAYTPLGGTATSANAINDVGQTAGMFITSNSQGHAFRSTSGVVQDLGTIGGGTWSSAYGINRSSTVVGYGMTASGSFRAFVAPAAGGISALGTLGGSNSYGMSINNNGLAVGSATNGAGYLHAAEWNTSLSNPSAIDLGTLGGSNSSAYGINSSGQIVGYSYLANSPDSHAFLYSGGIMYDLNNMLNPAAAGWELLNAYGINDRGQIVGTGIINGQTDAFVLTPQLSLGAPAPTGASSTPEPDSIVFAALGMVFIAGCKLLNRLKPVAIVQPME